PDYAQIRSTALLECEVGLGEGGLLELPARSCHHARACRSAPPAVVAASSAIGDRTPARRNFDSAKPCIPSAHCRSTIAPFTGCSSASALPIISGSQIRKSSHIGGAYSNSTASAAGTMV